MRYLLAIALCACGQAPDRAGPPPAPPASARGDVAAAPANQASLDARDQYALLDAMHDAEQRDPTEQASAFAAVRSDWQGQRIRWEMMPVMGLCRSAQACSFALFDLGRSAGASFLPRAAMNDADHAAMREACGEDVCIATIEATIEDLAFTLDDATTITLSDAHFVSARPKREDEYFLSRPPMRLPEGMVPGASGPWARAIRAARSRR